MTYVFKHPKLDAMARATRAEIDPEPHPPAAAPAWPVMDDAAYYGLAGEVVRTIGPQSEADPVALLLQFLTLAGNAIGRTPYYQVESDRHQTNLFGVMVGDSAITRTDLANGFANRFLFALIRRSKELPFGGELSDSEILHLGEQLKRVVEKTKTLGRVVMTDAARVKWKAVYSALSAAQPGLLGAVTARSEAQTVRLALVYALLDGKGEIDEPHLQAALAVWEYCEASAAHIFGTALGDPVADEILRVLQQAGDDGMTRTAIRDLFGRHKSGDRIGAALTLLATRGRARVETRESGGRPVEMWFAAREARRG